MNVCFHITNQIQGCYEVSPHCAPCSWVVYGVCHVVLEQHLWEWDITVCKKPLVIMDKYVIIDTLMSYGDG